MLLFRDDFLGQCWLSSSLLIVSEMYFSVVYFLFSVPVHKVDDITHVNFTDRDHLWFDPNWKNGNNNKEMQQQSRESVEQVEDPMAVMLENNAKNTNAANIFVNKLHGLVSEYAEVNHDLELRHNGTEKNRQQHQQGPYATTTLLEPSNVRQYTFTGIYYHQGLSFFLFLQGLIVYPIVILAISGAGILCCFSSTT